MTTKLKVRTHVLKEEMLDNTDIDQGIDSMPVSFGTDIPRLRGDHKRYLYGPGSILDAHTDNEQVTIPDLIKCVAVYKQLLMMCLEKKS